jgi:hypothetical protein
MAAGYAERRDAALASEHWDETVEDAICDAIATSSVLQIEKILADRKDLPSRTVFQHHLYRSEGFGRKYLRAREAQVTLLLDRSMERLENVLEPENLPSGLPKELHDPRLLNVIVSHAREVQRAAAGYAGLIAPRMYGNETKMRLQIDGDLGSQLSKALAREKKREEARNGEPAADRSEDDTAGGRKT